MTDAELHRVVNLVLLAALMFAWAWSIATHRRYFNRRQIAISLAQLPLFAVIFKGTVRAYQDAAPTTVDTWLLSFVVGALLAVMAAPAWIYHDRTDPDQPNERDPHG